MPPARGVKGDNPLVDELEGVVAQTEEAVAVPTKYASRPRKESVAEEASVVHEVTIEGPPYEADQEASFSATQARALEQFLFSPNDEILTEMSDIGLHKKLKSYLLKGALVEHELYIRFVHAWEHYFKLREEMEAQKAAQETADLRVMTKESDVMVLKRVAPLPTPPPVDSAPLAPGPASTSGSAQALPLSLSPAPSFAL
ncbi:uncharacterized protein A4U43_C08F18980 [Asparagus officinalis]|nr:uncharacterized protein A4U43_C08F18980 [Asparagus officinalis]